VSIGRPIAYAGKKVIMATDETHLSGVRFLTVAEVATIMRISKMTVYRLVHSGELEAIRVGRSFRIPEQAAYQYLYLSRLGTPVRIYLAAGDDPEPVELAVLGLLDAYGFEVGHLNVPIMGSWFREFLVRAKKSTPSVEEQLIKLTRSIELQGLDRPQSEVDLNQAEAVSRLLSVLDPESDALIQVGSVFLLKFDNKVIVRNLTQTELAYFNQNPALFQDPGRALQVLQRDWPEQQPPSTAAGG
jgi:excisionase family DNA binding protein